MILTRSVCNFLTFSVGYPRIRGGPKRFNEELSENWKPTWYRLQMGQIRIPRSYRKAQSNLSLKKIVASVTDSIGHWKRFFPAITPLYLPVWMEERAECSKNRQPWYDVIHCRMLILYLVVTSFIAEFLFCTWQCRNSLPDSYLVPGSDVIHCRSTKVCFSGKVFCWLVMAISGHS